MQRHGALCGCSRSLSPGLSSCTSAATLLACCGSTATVSVVNDAKHATHHLVTTKAVLAELDVRHTRLSTMNAEEVSDSNHYMQLCYRLEVELQDVAQHARQRDSLSKPVVT